MNEQTIVLRYREWRATTEKYHEADSLESWSIFARFATTREELDLIDSADVDKFYDLYIADPPTPIDAESDLQPIEPAVQTQQRVFKIKDGLATIRVRSRLAHLDTNSKGMRDAEFGTDKEVARVS